MKNYLLSILAAVAVLCTACGGGDEPAKVNVTGVKLDKTKVVLEIGESTTVKATLAPENATNKTVKWAVKNTAIATVADGVVTGVAVGETTLIVTTVDGGHTATIPVKVTAKAVKVSQIKLVGMPTTDFEVGRSVTISAVITPDDATDKSVTFTSSNPEVATVEYTKSENNYSLALLKAVGPGKATITATANDGSGVKAEAEVTVTSAKPTSITFDGKTDQEIYTWWGKEVDLKAKIEPSGASLKSLKWIWHDVNSDSNPDGLKYNVTDDKATLTYTWPSQTSKLRGVEVRAFYGNGNTVYARAKVYFQTFAWLLKYSEDAINYEGLYPLTQDFDYKWNWEDYQSNKLAFIAYYRSSGRENAMPQYYKEYYIPTSEYTLTSSDPSKVKVTKSADGESWDIERLNTTDLVAVTLTYKCGDHTQTYTINLIP